MNPSWESLANQLSGAILNSLYQGCLLAAVVWIAWRFSKRVNAATRYAVEWIVLLLVAALPVAHFLLSDSPAAPLAPLRHPDSSPILAPLLDRQMSSPAEESLLRAHDSSAQNLISAMLDADPSQELPGGALDSAWHASVRPDTSGRLAEVWGMMKRTNWHWSPPAWFGLAFLVSWILLAFLRLGGLGRQYWILHRLQWQARSAPEHLTRLLDEAGVEWRMRRPVRLLVSSALTTPIATGFSRPAVLLPERLLAEVEEEDWKRILRHELAHLLRHDDWTNLVQQVLKAIWFFHPAVWWLSRRLTIDREIACDDHVLATISQPRAYALFLTNFAGRDQHRAWAAAPAAWINPSQLKERITMILDQNRNASTRLARMKTGTLTLLTVLLTLAAFHCGPRLALAHTEESASTEPSHLQVGAPASISLASGEEIELLNRSRVGPELQVPVSSSVGSPKSRVTGAASTLSFVGAILRSTGGNDSLPPTPPPPPPAPHVPEPVAVQPSAPFEIEEERTVADSDTMERRLERLERMVESLVRFEAIDSGVGAKKASADESRTMERGSTQERPSRMESKGPRVAMNDPALKLEGKRVVRDELLWHESHPELKRTMEEVERTLKRMDLTAKETFVWGRRQSVEASVLSDLVPHRRALLEQRKALQKELQIIEEQLQKLEAKDAADYRLFEEHGDLFKPAQNGNSTKK